MITPVGKITVCRGCGKSIVFLRTNSGKVTPVDADTVDGKDTFYEHGRHRSHFATCPDSESFKKARK